MPRLIGAHTIGTGGIAMAARRAGSAGMSALQIFSAVPKYYNEKVGVKPERVQGFHAALADVGIARDAVIVHAGYVLNCATPEEGACRDCAHEGAGAQHGACGARRLLSSGGRNGQGS